MYTNRLRRFSQSVSRMHVGHIQSVLQLLSRRVASKASDAAAAIGEGLQAFCIPGSVADHRKVGLGHGNLGKMLLEEETECFCFLAGHESFAAAEGAIGIAEKANKVRQKPLQCYLKRSWQRCCSDYLTY